MKVENKNTDKYSGGLKHSLKNELILKSTYCLQLSNRQVRVVFSDNPNAQTIENVLVKIVTKRIG